MSDTLLLLLPKDHPKDKRFRSFPEDVRTLLKISEDFDMFTDEDIENMPLVSWM